MPDTSRPSTTPRAVANATRCPGNRFLGAAVAMAMALLWPAAAGAATDYVEGDVIVTFKASTSLHAAQVALGKKALAFTRRYGELSAKRSRQTGLIRHAKKTTAELIEELKQDPNVETVEPNYLRWPKAQPNDPRFKDLWGLRNTGQAVDGVTGTAGADVKYIDAWNLARSTASEIVVGVIDSGVDYTHPDLQANMWINAGEVAGNNADDDSNGYIDDYHGYDFAGDDSDPSDADNHGTHVAGTIAAVGDNQAGIIGVNHRAKVMALKVSTDGESFSTSAVIEALEYATLLKGRGVNIVALNASYGGGGFSNAERAAIQAAGNAGIILCAAAGNESSNNDSVATYPANYRLPNMIVVAASTQKDALATFSNYGAAKVDIAAPGTNILSAEPASIDIKVGAAAYESEALTYSGATSGLSGQIYDCGIGNEEDFPAAVSGNIALIERGTLTFATKVRNAMAAGAKAAIIYNNVAGMFYGTLGQADEWIPARSVSQADGLTIKSALPASASWVVTVGYHYLDGTSMATPHVSGAVAFAAMNFPAETTAERIERILGSADVKTGLTGKVATNGRLNLLRTVDVNDNGTADWFEPTGANPPTITHATPLPGGAVSYAYSETLSASGGTAPYRWSLLSGALPAGMALNANGVLSGTPTSAGSVTFAVQVKDNANATSAKFFTLTIATTPLAITTAGSLPGGMAGSAYSLPFAAMGGNPPYSWSVVSGSLPGGLTFDASGNLAGTPTAIGAFSFRVRVTDGSQQTDEESFALAIDPPPLVVATAAPLPVGVLALPYSRTLTATGGVGPYNWSISEGTLPAGLTLSAQGGISGAPAATGVFAFTTLVTDSGARTAAKSFVITIEETTITVTTPSPLIGAVKGLAYSAALTATGGTAPYTWALKSGSLPTGMALASNGMLGGKAINSGIFPFTVAVTDAIGLVVTHDFELTVTATYLKPVIHPITFESTTVGVLFRATVTAANYPKSFSITKLPPGLAYAAATGVISGRPTTPGTYLVQVKATNPGGTSDVVTAPLVINPLPAGFVGAFTGIVARDAAANLNLGSRLTLTTTKTGAYTAKVVTGATTKSVTGFLAATAPHINVGVGGQTLSLTLGGMSQLVAGTYGGATVTGWRSTWGTANPAATRAGYYTVALDLADAADDGVLTIPQGSGYASFTVAAGGTCTVAGKTADGTAFTSAMFLGPNGEMAIYSPLYGNRGSLVGVLGLTEDPAKAFLENTVAGTLTWSKPATTARVYSSGFGALNLTVFGKWLAASSARGIASGLPTAGAAGLLFTDGGLAESQTDPDVASFTYTDAKTVVMPAAGSSGNEARATLAINKNTGLIGGSFTLVESNPALTRRVTFQGLVVRAASGTPKGAGFFLLPQIPGVGQTISTSPILSGGVVIEQTPAVE